MVPGPIVKQDTLVLSSDVGRKEELVRQKSERAIFINTHACLVVRDFTATNKKGKNTNTFLEF